MKVLVKSRIDESDSDINRMIDNRESFALSGLEKTQAVRVLEALIERPAMFTLKTAQRLWGQLLFQQV